ncbi:MAG: hypothetical protein L3J07_02755 [Candidatus Magasanikbacteria bacterium]|nr:hypothetical protein [Candidatus Magasanikbacteria bacterium]
MYLLIDPSDRKKNKLVLFNEKKKEISTEYKRNTDGLPEAVDKFFKNNKIEKETLKGIMVVVGSGGFTSTRVATTVVNSFLYVLDIPGLAITKKQSLEPKKLIKKLKKQNKGDFIFASYSGKPSIGKKSFWRKILKIKLWK